MNSPSEKSLQDDATRDKSLSISEAGCLLLTLSPVILFVGAMRWNIKDKLDADLAMIMTWFCDSVLLFLLLLPMARTKYKSALTEKLFAVVSAKFYFMIYTFYIVAVVTFVIAALVAFHYLLSELFFALFGQKL